MAAIESGFQGRLIRELRGIFPGCVILKNDPNYLQGVPDLIILWGEYWASLECKASPDSPQQPNQDYYVDLMDAMSFSAFICPENKDHVLDELQLAFRSRRQPRVSERQQLSLDKLRRREAGGRIPKLANGSTRGRASRVRS